MQNISEINNSGEHAHVIGKKDYWGSGYFKEASTLILNYGFFTLDLNRIYAGVEEGNIVTIILDKMGWKKEGLKRQAVYNNGKYNNVVVYGLLREDWEKSKL